MPGMTRKFEIEREMSSDMPMDMVIKMVSIFLVLYNYPYIQAANVIQRLGGLESQARNESKLNAKQNCQRRQNYPNTPKQIYLNLLHYHHG